MASISTYPGDIHVIQFVHARKRHTISLGKIKPDKAEAIKAKIEFILQDKANGQTHETDTLKWIRTIGDKLHRKLADIGLVEPRAKEITLGPFIAELISKRKAKPSSKEVWRQGQMGLIEFFGPAKPLANITPGLSDDYKSFLQSKAVKSRARKPSDTEPVKKLSPMTVRNRLHFARMVFNAAVRHKLIAENPFKDVDTKAASPDRKHYITPDDTAKLMEAAPGHDWRTIIALARWGGMRSPSEVLSLTWADIDWERGRVRVTSPKTEHHEGGGSRMMPLFPELRPYLEQAFEAAPEGAVYVVDERFRKVATGPLGWRNCNLRARFEKIVERAGLTPWPRIFHNLRSSRQTELEERFPTHVVCAWLGNSPDIAREHYLQVTDEHFERATASANSVQYQPVSASNESCKKKENVEITGGYDKLLCCTSVNADNRHFDAPAGAGDEGTLDDEAGFDAAS
jgi:integrase